MSYRQHGKAGVTNATGLSITKPTGATNNYYMSFDTADATAAGPISGASRCPTPGQPGTSTSSAHRRCHWKATQPGRGSGFTIAQRVDDALARLQAAEQERDELVRSVGLEPGENYHIAEDGTVLWASMVLCN